MSSSRQLATEAAAALAGDAPSADEQMKDAPDCWRWWYSRSVAALAIPLALFIVLRPEAYGTVPNQLDMFFYSGYTMNWDDIMRAVGGRHYFVSRWTAYMPGRPFTWMFGAYDGRLVLRWFVASAILLALWHLGRRWRWNRTTEVTVAVIVLTSPIFARAFLTDYVEWFVVATGIIFVAQCLESRQHLARAASIGVLGASIAIANPFGLFMVAAPSLAYLVHLRGSWRTRLLHAGLAATTGFATVLAGWLAFRWLYHIPDVYGPTVDFIRERSGVRDPLKSPRLTWMAAFTWIYVPALLVVAVVIIPPLRRAVSGLERGTTVVVLLVAQYAWQWFDQFVRDGDGLEVSYYWSFIYPTLAVALAMVLGIVRWTWRSAAMLLGAWWAILVVARVRPPHLPAGWAFGVVAAGLIAAVWLLIDKHRSVAIGMLMTFLLTAQVASPHYDPSAYHPYNLDPLYGDIVYNSGSMSTKEFEQAIWFADQLDSLPDDSDLNFFAVGNPAAIVAIYGAQISDKFIRPDASGLPQNYVDLARFGGLGKMVLYGPVDIVDDGVRRLTTEAGGSVRLRENDPIVDGYELAVVEMPANATVTN